MAGGGHAIKRHHLLCLRKGVLTETTILCFGGSCWSIIVLTISRTPSCFLRRKPGFRGVGGLSLELSQPLPSPTKRATKTTYIVIWVWCGTFKLGVSSGKE